MKKHDRKAEIIACCNGIIRNAEKITEDYGHNQGLEVTIKIYPNEAPTVTIKRSMIPQELIEVLIGGDSNQ